MSLRTRTALFVAGLIACLATPSVVSAGAALTIDVWGSGGGVGNVGGLGVGISDTDSLLLASPSEDRLSDYQNGGLFGPLQMPDGAFGDGDLGVVQLFTGNSLTGTITFDLLDEIVDPIFYFFDADIDGAQVTVPGGFDDSFLSGGSALAGNVVTFSDPANNNANGAGAFLYAGSFAPSSTFDFEFDWSGGTGFSSENVFVGVGSLAVVPEPSFWVLLAAGLPLWMAARWFQRNC